MNELKVIDYLILAFVVLHFLTWLISFTYLAYKTVSVPDALTDILYKSAAEKFWGDMWKPALAIMFLAWRLWG